MEACALSLDSPGGLFDSCEMGERVRERRAGEKGDGTGWDGIEGRKEGIEERRVICN